MTRAFTAEDALELLARLVAVPSPSGDEGAAADLVVATCARLGLDVERAGSSVIVRVGSTGPLVLLTSHLDTVPVGEGWTRAPHGEGWKDGVLYGRGANDAKASVVAMLFAAAELAARPPGEGRLVVALNACEETDGSGMRAVLERIERPDAAVVGEPTSLEVVRAQGGLVVLEAEWRGSSCHAAHVEAVPHASALAAAARELSAFGPFRTLPGTHPLLGRSTLVPTVLRSGERHNVVPDRALATFDARVAPPHGGEDCRRFLAAALPGAEVRVRSARLAAVETPEDHPLVRTALELAGQARAAGSKTLSDMAQLAGIPAIKCGPGATARSHTPDEHVTRDEVLAGCRFYARLVPALLASPSPLVCAAR